MMHLIHLLKFRARTGEDLEPIEFTNFRLLPSKIKQLEKYFIIIKFYIE